MFYLSQRLRRSPLTRASFSCVTASSSGIWKLPSLRLSLNDPWTPSKPLDGMQSDDELTDGAQPAKNVVLGDRPRSMFLAAPRVSHWHFGRPVDGDAAVASTSTPNTAPWRARIRLQRSLSKHTLRFCLSRMRCCRLISGHRRTVFPEEADFQPFKSRPIKHRFVHHEGNACSLRFHI